MNSKIALKWYAILFPGIKTYVENDIFVYVCLFAHCEHNIDDMDQKSRGFENWIIYLPKSDFFFEKVQ